jgi:hypothetical protein
MHADSQTTKNTEATKVRLCIRRWTQINADFQPTTDYRLPALHRERREPCEGTEGWGP